ncbi:hypothetical protein HOLleu_24973 [Holothuria leucospilota]|uniref:C2H2-type domain-containing protein n=1 Tax=Holothuria leucospilota TaxID=206669 RepID=A0A9Q1BRF2_HOLLE|nr:hypothetical protein HOLleu_24973 [Holothuria leucospilota]
MANKIALRKDWGVLIGNIIANHLPTLKWMSAEIPSVIAHHHMSEMKKKSEVVLWEHLYDVSSSVDKVTLFAARNFFGVRNVTADPMKNINAASDLVDTYTKALVTAAAMEHFGTDTPQDEPTQNKINLEVHHDSNFYVKSLLKEIIEKLVIPHKDEISHSTPQFQCNQCTKWYKTKGGLQRHMRTKHLYQPAAPTTSQPDGQANIQNDAVLNYVRYVARLTVSGTDL